MQSLATCRSAPHWVLRRDLQAAAPCAISTVLPGTTSWRLFPAVRNPQHDVLMHTQCASLLHRLYACGSSPCTQHTKPLSPCGSHLLQAVRVWLLTLPLALRQYVDSLTGPGGLLLHWDDTVGDYPKP